jgi:hypothetical protein
VFVPDLLIVPDVARFTMRFSQYGIPVNNVLDIKVLPTGATTRDAICQAECQAIIDSWYTNLRPQQVNEITLNAIDFVDLDSSTGPTGTVTASGTHTLPQAGSNVADDFPTFVALRALKNTVAARGLRGGSMFIGGMTETSTAIDAGNTINPAYVAGWNTNLAGFLAGINATFTGAVTGTGKLQVVHRPLVGDPTSTDVTSLTIDTRVTQQVRRK